MTSTMKNIFPVLLLAILQLVTFYPISSNAGCKFVRPDQFYFCFEATYDDIKVIPKNAQDIRFGKSKLDLPQRAFAGFNLTTLTFVFTEIKSISSNAFDGLQNLQSLLFYESLNHYDHIKTSWFGKLNSLIRLSVTEHTVRHIESDFYQLIPNLLTLRIEKYNLRCCLDIAPLESLKKLRRVMLGLQYDHCGSTSDIIEWLKNERNILQRNLPMKPRRELSTPQLEDFEVPSTELPFRTLFTTLQDDELEVNKGREISIVNNTLNYLRFISDDVRSIKFSNSEISEIPQSAFERFGNSLISLSFLNCSIQTIHPDAFKGLYKLKNLILFNNSLSAVCWQWFESLRNLEYLVIESNEIEHIQLRVFPLLSNLKYLNIANNKIECIPINKFELLKNLEQIFLAYNPWDCQCHEILRKWLHRQKIRYVTSRGPCENGTLQMTNDLFEQNFEKPNNKDTGPTDADAMEEGQFENTGNLVLISENQELEITNEDYDDMMKKL